MRTIKDFCSTMGSYFTSRYKLFLFYIFWSSVFVAVFYVSNVSFEIFGYALLISTCGGFVFLTLDVISYYRKHKLLQSLHKTITQELAHLPATQDGTEKAYQELLLAIHRDKTELSSKWRGQMTDLMDYYTLWTHQIKTPIAAMKLLLQENEQPKDSKSLQELFKIERYVDLAIQYARLESMSSDLLIEPHDLDEIIKSAIKKYATIFIGKRIKLDYRECHCSVISDKKWLIFVLEQLLSNALKYTPEEGTISIYLSADEPLTLIIEDTGIGIRTEDLPRIFENGFTGYNGRMDQKATGIGLSLSKKVMDKLSHKIRITSVVGKGTKVAMDLSTEKASFD